MTRLEEIGAFEDSFDPPPETLCEFIYDTCEDRFLKALNSQPPAIGVNGVAQSISRMTSFSASLILESSKKGVAFLKLRSEAC